MPFQSQRMQFGDLGLRFLHVVFAERALALRRQHGEGIRRPGLGHCEQAYIGMGLLGRGGVDGIENLL